MLRRNDFGIRRRRPESSAAIYAALEPLSSMLERMAFIKE